WRCAGGDRKMTRAGPRERRRPRPWPGSSYGGGDRSGCARSTDLPPLARSQHVDQSAISMRPRWYAFARRRGTEAVRPRTVTCTRSALLAFHCERRERVRARDILNLGTAMGRSLTVRRVNERWHPPEQRPEPGPTE